MQKVNIAFTIFILSFIISLSSSITLAILIGMFRLSDPRDSCFNMKTELDCQDYCGCGWCNYENDNLDSCQPLANRHCGGRYNEVPSARCQDRYGGNKIRYLWPLIPLSIGFLSLTTSLCILHGYRGEILSQSVIIR